MKPLRKNPHLYEINLMPWLKHLSHEKEQRITLENIPNGIWLHLKEIGMDLVWLMGMWQRSADSRRRARREAGLLNDCRSMLGDFKAEDIAGSPYAIGRYLPDPFFGESQDLLSLKERFKDMGLSLILDFVPNHTACDHPWMRQDPEYFVQARPTKKGRCPKGFFPAKDAPARPCIAHGRDPFFSPWNDTAQVNYGNPKAMAAMLDTLSNIIRYCHGLRCDMAMLVLKDVFRKTWRRYVKNAGEKEFWPHAIEILKSSGGQCLLIAEVYWGMEQKLIDLGFDYTYDKTFYDLLVSFDIKGLRSHLSASVEKQEKMVRFLENHDEPRAMHVFGEERIFGAMVIHATVPGMRFWHHGQFDGNRVRVPVQLARAPVEPVQHELKAFSEKLLQEVNQSVFHDGIWKMCETRGWPDNQSHMGLLAWCWWRGNERRLIVVNFTPSPAQGLVRMPANWLPKAETFFCIDPLKGDKYKRATSETDTSGLHVELEKWDYHFFRVVKGS